MRVGLLWRAEWDPPQGEIRESCRLSGVFAAFTGAGAEAEPVVYSDDRVDAVREQLLELDGVLVWVNPVEQGRDRSLLDPLLREVAGAGIWVSAHPDVIDRMATKRVLVDTASMSWSSDTRLYTSADELVAELPSRLATPRVLKRERGMGGDGVWKVELDGDGLRVEHAGEGSIETLSLADLADRCFSGGGVVVDQPYLERIRDGMIRVYLTHDRVVGFAHQYPRGLRPEAAGEPPPGKHFFPPADERFARLRALLDVQWVPQLQRLLGLESHTLPVIWDADFLYGPKNADGHDTYVLCEINASSTFAFPEFAMPGVAEAALERIRAGSSP